MSGLGIAAGAACADPSSVANPLTAPMTPMIFLSIGKSLWFDSVSTHVPGAFQSTCAFFKTRKQDDGSVDGRPSRSARLPHA
jgi:hypothetical protein